MSASFFQNCGLSTPASPGGVSVAGAGASPPAGATGCGVPFGVGGGAGVGTAPCPGALGCAGARSGCAYPKGEFAGIAEAGVGDGGGLLAPAGAAVSLPPNSQGSSPSLEDALFGIDCGRTSFIASVMKLCQISAGIVPPVIFFIGLLSSLPTQTPVTNCGVKPMNHASL